MRARRVPHRLFSALVLFAGAFSEPCLPIRASIASPSAPAMELYGTFKSMGVIITLEGSDDPDGNATAALAYRASADVTFR